jgi:hypothetical protein
VNVLRDAEFQKILLSFICRDRTFVKNVGYLLTPDDFKPVSKSDGQEIHTVAKLAFDHYNKTREPIGALLRTFVLDYADHKKLGEKPTLKLLEIVKEINNGHKDVISVEAVADKVIAFKKNRLKKLALEQAIHLMDKGELTDEKWYSICQQAVDTFSSKVDPLDYFEEAEQRIKRREHQERTVRYPLTFIDPLDEHVRTITRKQSGLIMAITKGGKSLLALWLAFHYALQGLNSLLLSLEDGEQITTDRLDALVTGICIRDLNEESDKFKKKFKRIKNLIHSKIKIIDGTEGGWSVARMEDEWNRLRNKGWIADATFCDYDEEVDPPIKYGKDPSALRLQLSDIHKEFRRYISRTNQYGWMLCQTNRGADGRKWLSKRHIGEDYSKLKKTHCAIGIGDGDWGDNSKFVQIIASKNDKMKIGWNIMTDFERGTFYVRDATLKMMRKEQHKQKQGKE